MIRVLGRATSGNVQKVVWLLEELGTPYAREDYGRQFNNTQSESYLKMNPNAKVPTLVDGDLVIWESNTILRYLCNTSAGGARLYPSDPAARSQVERWMDWQLSALYAPYLGCFKEAKKTDAERASSPTWAADSRELGVQLQILEKGIGDRPFIAGGDLSIADIALGPIVDRCLKFPVALPALPSVGAWRDRLAARPAYKKVIS